MTTSPASTAHASFFDYTGTDCDPDLSFAPRAVRRGTSLWLLVVSSACLGAAVGRLSARRA